MMLPLILLCSLDLIEAASFLINNGVDAISINGTDPVRTLLLHFLCFSLLDIVAMTVALAALPN